MDFEIEEDDDPYQFDWDDNDAPKSQNKSKPKSSFFSAGNDEDEYNYDYNFSKANNSKKKSVVYDEPIPAFSPVASNRGSANSSMPNSTQSRDNPNLTAMEKAKSMLNKYSNKSFDQPKSNFKNRKPDTLFDEDEISISDDDDSGSKYKAPKGKASTDSKGIATNSVKKGSTNERPMAIRTSSYDFEEAEDSQNSEGMGNLDAGKSQFIGDDEESGDFEVDHINSRADYERSKLIQSPLASNNKNEIGATSFSRIGYDDDHDDSEEFDTSEGVSKSNILSFGDLAAEEGSKGRDEEESEIMEESQINSKPKHKEIVSAAEVESSLRDNVDEKELIDSSKKSNSLGKVQHFSLAALDDAIVAPRATEINTFQVYEVPKPNPFPAVKPANDRVAQSGIDSGYHLPTTSIQGVGNANTKAGGHNGVQNAAQTAYSGVTATTTTPNSGQQQFVPAQQQPFPQQQPSQQQQQAPLNNMNYLPGSAVSNPYQPPSGMPEQIQINNRMSYAPQGGFGGASFPPQAGAATLPSTNSSWPYGIPAPFPGYPPVYNYPYPPMATGYSPHPQHPYPPFPSYPSPYMGSFPLISSIDPMRSSLNGFGSSPFSSSHLYNSTSRQQEVQQPLLAELLEELRKSKEEAEWARKKLAETIMLVKEIEHGASSSKEMDPLKVMPTDRSDKKNNRYNEVDNSDGDEEYEDDYIEESFESAASNDIKDESADYSDDFEALAIKPKSPDKKNKNGVGRSSNEFKPKTSRSVEGIPGRGSPRTSVNNNRRSYSDTIEEKIKEIEAHERNKFLNSNFTPEELILDSTERVLRPLRESLARSLHSSQEVFRSQLESLRLRLSMTNGFPTDSRGVVSEQEKEEESSSKYQSAPSLSSIKKQFQTQRERNSVRLYELLKENYPELSEQEAMKLSTKF